MQIQPPTKRVDKISLASYLNGNKIKLGLQCAGPELGCGKDSLWRSQNRRHPTGALLILDVEKADESTLLLRLEIDVGCVDKVGPVSFATGLDD